MITVPPISENVKKFFGDDKLLLITSLTVVCIFSIAYLKLDALPLVSNCVSGMLGMATGSMIK